MPEVEHLNGGEHPDVVCVLMEGVAWQSFIGMDVSWHVLLQISQLLSTAGFQGK